MRPLAPADRQTAWATTLPLRRALKPLKYHATTNKKTLPETTPPDHKITYIDIGSVNPQGEITATEELTFENAPSRARRIPEPGDVLVSTVRTYLKAIAATPAAPTDLVCSTGFAILHPYGDLNHRFLYYWMRSSRVVDEISARSTGVSYPSINASELGSLPVPIISLEAQRNISNFLDRKTAAIDELVRKKERLIELLQEKRQALITQAVTKGLDPSVPMKDSGVEWIGRTPSHWKIKALKRETRVKRGASPRPIEDPRYFDDNGEYGWVRIMDVTAASGRLKTTSQTLSELGAQLSVKMKPGDLFLSIAGTVGKPCITNIKCCIHDGFVYFPDLKMDRDFLWYIFESDRAYGGLGKLGTQLNLNTDTVAAIQIPVPPAREQMAIKNHLSEALDSMMTCLNKTARSCNALREYRQALISAAVSGELAVPEYEDLDTEPSTAEVA